MNCPTCKNPLQQNSSECEWCGNSFNNSSSNVNSFLVEKIVSKRGIGTLLEGKYNDITEVKCGDSISYIFQGVISIAIVCGIEVSGKLIDTYNGNQKIIILIK
jgi:hypothetical protein